MHQLSGIMIVAFARWLEVVGAACLILMASEADARTAPGSAVRAVIEDPARSADDRALDVNRKPGEVLAFAGVAIGQKIGERFPGEGYWTRLLSKAVGAEGHVYMLLLQYKDGLPYDLDKAEPVVAALPNASLVSKTVAQALPPEPLDLVVSILNFHDLYNEGIADYPLRFNKGVFGALKPGGIYLVIDHSAAPGAGSSVTETLHRVEEATVKAVAKEAGFELIDESNALANPMDPRTIPNWDKSVDGRSDRFMLKFRRPS